MNEKTYGPIKSIFIDEIPSTPERQSRFWGLYCELKLRLEASSEREGLAVPFKEIVEAKAASVALRRCCRRHGDEIRIIYCPLVEPNVLYIRKGKPRRGRNGEASDNGGPHVNED